MHRTIDLMSDCSERVPYPVAGYPAYAQRSFLSIYRDMGTASHWHDDMELSLVLSGYMTYVVNGTAVRLREGEGIFVNARQLHSNFSEDGTDCEYMCALVHPSLLCAAPYIEGEHILPLTTNASFPFAVLRPEVPWQAELLETILRIGETVAVRGKAWALAYQAQAFHVASLLCEHMPAVEPASVRVDRKLSVLRSMVGFVQLHYEEKITLADIAAAGDVSESSCCALFRQQLRQTPMRYLARYRLEKGVELLEQTDLSVIDIALAIGFSSASYFTETFHRSLGLTPSEYRKRKK